MIDPLDAQPGLSVFYQQPHMPRPEYGLIVGVRIRVFASESLVHVLFLGDTTAKACYPRDLYWPPDYCASGRVNPSGQVSREQE